jgi:hypothetical protein
MPPASPCSINPTPAMASALAFRSMIFARSLPMYHLRMSTMPVTPIRKSDKSAQYATMSAAWWKCSSKTTGTVTATSIHQQRQTINPDLFATKAAGASTRIVIKNSIASCSRKNSNLI